MRKPVIAIDGYSSTGKSSISKQIASRLGIIHMDTGALYRGATWYALQNFRDENGDISIENFLANLDKMHLEFRREGDVLVLYLNGEDISKEIRKPEVSAKVSLIAKQPEVRNFLLEMQRKAAEKGGVVMDGRDIGTVILPGADYKFFLTASIEERTKRRLLELQNSGENISESEVMENLKMRDQTDSERENAPLKAAEDAIYIDNSNLDKQQTIDLILSYIL